MGTGKKMKCKSCGAEWFLLQGVGFDNQAPAENQEQDPEICPECGSRDITDTDIQILWD